MAKRVFLLNAAFAVAVVDLNSRAYLALFLIIIPKQFQYSTFYSR